MPHKPAGRPIARWVRALAALYLLSLLAVAAGMAVKAMSGHGLALPTAPFRGVFGGLAFTYLSLLFGCVAITGRQPDRLFPFGGLHWPLSSPANRRYFRWLGLRFRNRR